MSIFISYSSKNIEQVGLLDSENLKNENLDLWIAYQKKENKRNINIGEDFEPEILDAIKSSSASILFVSKEYLDASFVIDKELPEIFRKKSLDSEYKIVPILVDNIHDFSKFPQLANLQYVNSPSTPFETLSGNQKRLVLREALDELSDSKLTKKNIFSKFNLSIAFATLAIGLIFYFINTTLFNNRDENVDTTNSNQEFIEFLEVGDCYSEQNSVDIWLTNFTGSSDGNDHKNEDINYAYTKNFAPKDKVNIVDCDSPHDYEIAHIFESSEDSFEDYEAKYSYFFGECITYSKLYIGNKNDIAITEFGAFSLPVWIELENKNLKVFCPIATYTDSKFDDNTVSAKHVRTSYSFKNFNLKGENVLYEKSFEDLIIGDCFNEPGAWDLRSLQRIVNKNDKSREALFGRYLDGWSDNVDVLNCKNDHDYELINIHKFDLLEEKLFIDYWDFGITGDFKTNDFTQSELSKFNLISNNYFEVEEIVSGSPYDLAGGNIGDRIYEINGANFINSEEVNFYKTVFQDDDRIYLLVDGEVPDTTQTLLHLKIIEKKKSPYEFNDANLVKYSNEACENDLFLFIGTELYNENLESQKFKADFVIKELENEIIVYCFIEKVQKVSTDIIAESIIPSSVSESSLEDIRIPKKGSLKNSLLQRYSDSSVKDYVYEYTSIKFESWKDVETGDCIRKVHPNYENLLNANDIVQVSSDCSRHDSQIISLKSLAKSDFDFKSKAFDDLAWQYCDLSLAYNYRSSDLYHMGFYSEREGNKREYQSSYEWKLIDVDEQNYKLVCLFWLSKEVNGQRVNVGHQFKPWNLKEEVEVDVENRLQIEFGNCPEYIYTSNESDGEYFEYVLLYSNVDSTIREVTITAEDSVGVFEYDLKEYSESEDYYFFYFSTLENILFEFPEYLNFFDRANGAVTDVIIWEGKPGEEGVLKATVRDYGGNSAEAICKISFIEN